MDVCATYIVDSAQHTLLHDVVSGFAIVTSLHNPQPTGRVFTYQYRQLNQNRSLQHVNVSTIQRKADQVDIVMGTSGTASTERRSVTFLACFYDDEGM